MRAVMSSVFTVLSGALQSQRLLWAVGVRVDPRNGTDFQSRVAPLLPRLSMFEHTTPLLVAGTIRFDREGRGGLVYMIFRVAR